MTTVFYLVISLTLFVSTSAVQKVELCESWQDVLHNTLLYTAGFPDTTATGHQCQVVITAPENDDVYISISVNLHSEFSHSCSPVLLIGKDGGPMVHICPDNQKSKDLMFLLPVKSQLTIAIYNSEHVPFAAALSITVSPLVALQATSYEQNDDVSLTNSDWLTKYSSDPMKSADPNPDTARIVGLIIIVLLLLTIYIAGIRLEISRCLKSMKKDASTKQDKIGDRNPAFSDTPSVCTGETSLYTPSVCTGETSLYTASHTSLVSSTSSVTADQGLELILRAGAKPSTIGIGALSASANLQPRNANLKTTGSRSSIDVDKLDGKPAGAGRAPFVVTRHPLRDDLPAEVCDPRSPGLVGLPPTFIPTYRHQAQPRNDQPQVHPYFDPRSPVVKSNLDKPNWPQQPVATTPKKSRFTDMSGHDDDELPSLPISPERHVIPPSPARPISRSSGDYGPERYSLQIRSPSGETEL